MSKVIVKITGYIPGNAVGDICGLDSEKAQAAINAGVAVPVAPATAPDKQIAAPEAPAQARKGAKTVKKG